jgi:tight adherence protein C
MLLILLLALAFAGTAAALVARAAMLPRIRADQNVARIAAYGYLPKAATPPDERSPVFPKLAALIGTALLRGAPAQREAGLRKIIMAAGAWKTTPAMVIGYRAIAAVLLGATALWGAAGAGWSPIVVAIFGSYAVAAGWVGPLFLLKARGKRRLEKIEVELPELIDLLVVTLEAGIGFNAAIHRSAERMTGPLADEIRLTLHEHDLGLEMNQALVNFLERCDAPSVRAFVRAVVQSEKLGVSIGQVMRELAGDIRKRRRQIVEEKAQKAPIKILFPLVLLILPALLMIVLYPGLYSIVQVLGGG